MKFGNSLSGRSIWVVGGAGHLGSAIVAALDAAGARVACADLPGRAEALVAERGLASTAAWPLDLTQGDALPAEVERAAARHGEPDGLVLLAFASSAGQTLAKLTPDEFQRTLERGLVPAFSLSRLVADRMRARGAGSVVLFASMYGQVAPDPRIYPEPLTPNPIDYGASKAALLQMCRYLAVHYGPSGVRFNCVTPGPFPNPAVQQAHPEFVRNLAARTALGRIGRNDEVVGPTLFLLSDDSSYVTGHSLVVDGGWTTW